MGRKNYDAYTDADWRQAASSLRAILANGWPVYAECDRCGVRIRADLERIAQIAGPSRSLWGAKPRCRCVGCPGRVTFYLHPPRAVLPIAMTAPPR
ncbi:hypothetical protein GCM10009101_11280 [Brevundimonas lenta]